MTSKEYDVRRSPGCQLFDGWSDFALRMLHALMIGRFGAVALGDEIFGHLLLELHRRGMITVNYDKEKQ